MDPRKGKIGDSPDYSGDWRYARGKIVHLTSVLAQGLGVDDHGCPVIIDFDLRAPGQEGPSGKIYVSIDIGIKPKRTPIVIRVR